QLLYFSFFFLQAQDGIRDRNVTGVQTCALPISTHMTTCMIAKLFILLVITRLARCGTSQYAIPKNMTTTETPTVIWKCPVINNEIGRASCREREELKYEETTARKEQIVRGKKKD